MNAASVLLIDDNLGFIEAASKNAHERGLRLDAVEDWAAALEEFQVGWHELVIADFMLGDSRTGLRLLATIKRMRPETRLVLISGILADDAPAELAGSFVDRYLPKGPLLMTELRAEIEIATDIAARPADWQKAAEATLADEIADEELDRIEAILKGSRTDL